MTKQYVHIKLNIKQQTQKRKQKNSEHKLTTLPPVKTYLNINRSVQPQKKNYHFSTTNEITGNRVSQHEG